MAGSPSLGLRAPVAPLFIVIEGLDGSGGTTQARMLAEWMRSLRRCEVIQTAEPSDGPVGRFIRQALRAEVRDDRLGDAVFPYLFAADRRDHLDRLIIPALQQSAAVVTDRYYHSSLAYQSLAVGFAVVAELNAGFLAPDLTVLLDLAPEECLKRIAARGGVRDRFEVIDRLRRVYDAYETVLMHCRARGERVVRVDAAGTVEEVHRRVRAEVERLLAERDQG